MSQISFDQKPNVSFTGSSILSSGQRFGINLHDGWPFRVVAILVLFALQGLWLTVRFDTASVATSSPVGYLFQFAPILPRIGMTLLILVPLLARNRILEHIQVFAQDSRRSRMWLAWWAAQWVSFAVLASASNVIFDDSMVDPTSNLSWTMIWILSAAATCLCCLFSIASPAFWSGFVRRECGAILFGLAASSCAATGGQLFQQLWKPLGDSTFWLVEWWLGFLYSDTIVSDAAERILGTTAFRVQIAPQCSGYEGIGLISVFLLVFLAVFRRSLRFPRAWLLLPLGIVTIWICNSLRIAALIVIGTEYSPSVALGGFHSQAGWILFNLVSLGLMAGALKSRYFTFATEQRIQKAGPVVPYLLPFLALTALSMFIAASVDDADALYPVTVLVSLVMLWMNRSVLKQLTWSWSAEAIVCGVAVFIAWAGLAWPDASSTGDVAAEAVLSSVSGWVWMAIRAFGAIVTVPLIEELAFRGFFMRRLARADFDKLDYQSVPVWTILVSSLAFGLLHELWLGGIVAGIAYAWLVRRRGNLADAIQAHAITNGLIVVTVMCTGATWLW